MAGTIYDIYKESNAASNAELERNFPTPAPGATPVRNLVSARRAAFEQGQPAFTSPSKADILRSNRLVLATPRGTSTIGGPAAFVPQFEGSAPAAVTPAAPSPWSEALRNTVSTVTKPAAGATSFPAMSAADKQKMIDYTAGATAPDIAGNIGRFAMADRGGNAPRVGDRVDLDKINQSKTMLGQGAASEGGNRLLLGNVSDYKPEQMTVGGVTSAKNDWSAGSANVKTLEVNDKYNTEVAAARRAEAIDKERTLNRTVLERVADMERTPSTWSKSPREMLASATEDFGAAQKRSAIAVADATTRRGQDETADWHNQQSADSLEGRKFTAEQNRLAHEVTAREGRLGRLESEKLRLAAAGQKVDNVPMAEVYKLDRAEQAAEKNAIDEAERMLGPKPKPEALAKITARRKDLAERQRITKLAAR